MHASVYECVCVSVWNLNANNRFYVVVVVVSIMIISRILIFFLFFRAHWLFTSKIFTKNIYIYSIREVNDNRCESIVYFINIYILKIIRLRITFEFPNSSSILLSNCGAISLELLSNQWICVLFPNDFQKQK